MGLTYSRVPERGRQCGGVGQNAGVVGLPGPRGEAGCGAGGGGGRHFCGARVVALAIEVFDLLFDLHLFLQTATVID